MRDVDVLDKTPVRIPALDHQRGAVPNRPWAKMTGDERAELAEAVRGHNRRTRRAMGWRGPIPSSLQPAVDTADIAVAICRDCRRQRQVYLPGRICGRCIEEGMRQAAKQMLAAMELEFGEELDGTE